LLPPRTSLAILAGVTPAVPTFALAALLSALTSACASAPVLEGPRPAAFRPVQVAAPVPDRAPPCKLYREDVLRHVDAGVPEFLQKIEVEAEVRDGRFVGWRVAALYPQDFWSGVDLERGDVITRVNDMPIERETQAYDAFQALKSAPRLVVSYTRAGKPRTLAYEIVPRPNAVGQVAAR
jgi:hypothetical protein